MGVALESFVQVIAIAGAVAIIPLILCIVTRFRAKNGSGTRLRRIPALLPSVTFVITVVLILLVGTLPMSVYQGSNHVVYNDALTMDNLSFEVYPSNIVYEDATYIEFESAIGSEQYFLLDFEFINDGTSIETISVNLTGNGVYRLDLDQGVYSILVNGTFYNSGVAQEGRPFVNLIFIQQTQSYFEMETHYWSLAQFYLFIISTIFILVGIRFDWKDEKDSRKKTIEIV